MVSVRYAFTSLAKTVEITKRSLQLVDERPLEYVSDVMVS